MSRFQSVGISKETVFGAVTDRTLAALRFVLSISALLIILIDPDEPNRLQNLTHFALIAYLVYSGVIYVLSRSRKNFSFGVMQLLTWIDVVWYSVLITLGTGTNAVFFFFYLFAIIAGSSRGGTRLGLMLTLVCTLLFLFLNLSFIQQLQLDIPRFARRTVYMAVLGYILAYWGGAEAHLRRRLTFLKEMSRVANPRLGVDRTIEGMLRRMLEHFQSDYAFMAINGVGDCLDFYCVHAKRTAECHPMNVRANSPVPLMGSTAPVLQVYVERRSPWSREPSYRICDIESETVKEGCSDDVADTAEMMNVRSFIAAPLRYHGRIRGRVLVGSNHPSLFEMEDAEFLLQAVDQIFPVIENIRIVDRLATDAADEERRKIARSVHDRVIQPYLGLQIGIKALQQELARAGVRDISHEAERSAKLLDELVLMTGDGIQELRQYVHGLRSPLESETTLVEAIRGFSTKFEGVTGIHVNVTGDTCDLTLKDSLAAEVFQMTAEALSNIRRHTCARKVEVCLSVVNDNLELSVENDSDVAPAPFRPSSIVERAEALGARTEIRWPLGKTLVRVEVPL